MMRTLVAAVLLSAAVGMGCQATPSKSKPMVQTAGTTSDILEQTRSDMMAHNSRAQVGLVAAVQEVDGRVALSQLKVEDFRPGDILTILNSKREIVANCVVERIQDSFVIVRYTASGTAAPVVGDMAVSLPS